MDIDDDNDESGNAAHSRSSAIPNSNPSPNSILSATSTSMTSPLEEDATILKRRAIQKIMRDTTLDEQTKRIQIQQIMDGSQKQQQSDMIVEDSTIRQNSISNPTCTLSHTSSHQQDVLTCIHYERKCNVVAPCCDRVFGCRVCHDENSTHEMDRFAIREIICKDCHTRQPTSNNCIKCNVIFAEYHCDKCNLWMGTNKQPFHCDKCGICRVGGEANFQHCDHCSMCISSETFSNHLCLKDKFKNSCPVCREDMYTSRHASLDLPCGHAIHTHCFRKLAAFDYRCPICKKTVVNRDTMSRAWADRKREIESQPMPSDLAREVTIWCNDCEKNSEKQNWHFLGVQCPNCTSFNTAVQNNFSASSNNNNNSNGDGDGGQNNSNNGRNNSGGENANDS
mmetsp:Transcript_6916/g.7549  ORF Transcript_6916/g.7549 Transcript_6916/m.7549 type:complete len:395 (-) Transcript_6916:465-1649(-)